MYIGAIKGSIPDAMKQIYSEGGIRGFWRGNIANCARVFPHKSILFSMNEVMKGRLNSDSKFISFITGAFSGLFATTATYPIDVIRAYLAGTLDKNADSMLKVSKQIYYNDGLKGFYKGLLVTCAGAVPYEALRIGVYAYLREYIPLINTKYGEQPHPIGKLFAGAAAGACAGIGTYPTDTIRRMLQVQSADGMPIYNNVYQCIYINYKNDGILRFYCGLTAKLVRVIPDAAILFFAYEYLKNIFDDIYL